MIAPTLTTPEEAKIEYARRQLARENLIDFCCYVDPGAAWEDAKDPYIDNKYRSPHLALAGEYIQKAITGELWESVPGSGKNILLISMPPGHWKSSLVSRKLPAWFMGYATNRGEPHQMILASYNAGLAESHSSKNLDLMQTGLYKNIFPNVKLSPKEQSNEKWSLDGYPFTSFKASGVGGGLTGFHARVAIVDDPIKDRKDAESPAKQKELWDWWQDVLKPRLLKDWPYSFILGMWTRWTKEDPIGRIYDQLASGESGDKVIYLRLPALAETETERRVAKKLGLPAGPDPLGRKPGEALWPRMESAADHLATKRSAPLTFDSLYQGLPRPPGGYKVGENDFKMLTAWPRKHVRWVWGTDWALKEKEESDYTVAALVGLWSPPKAEGELRIVIRYIARGQYNPHRARNMVREAAISAERPYPIIGGQANLDAVHLSDLRSHQDLLSFSITNLTRSQIPGDKLTKATPWIERAKAGQVYLVAGAWNREFIEEAEAFPKGAHDDQIDAVSVAVHGLGMKEKPRNAQSHKMRFYQ